MEKIEIVREMMSKGIKREESLRLAEISKNQFYYQPKGVKTGRLKSTTTKWRDPKTMNVEDIDNDKLVNQIINIKQDPDQANWYRLITHSLQIKGYYINHKKVYRLMNENLLLEEKPKPAGRNFVKYRKVAPTGPLQLIEMDIKHVMISGTSKQAYVFTIIDTFTRYILGWSVGYTMRNNQIKEVWESVIANYFQPKGIHPNDIIIELRSDNGRQFIASQLRDFFKQNGIDQVYTHPYTPEENGHIESFHSILGKALNKDEFQDIIQLDKRLNKFYINYNNDRSHSGTKGIPPALFWALYDEKQIEVVPLEKNKIQVKLKVVYQDILTVPNVKKYINQGIQLRRRKTFA